MADEKKIIEEVSGAVVKLTEVFKGLQEVINGNLTQQEQLIQYMTELKDAIGSSKELKDFVKVSAEMQKTQQALSKTQSDAIKIQQEAEKLKQQEIRTNIAATNALKAEEQHKQAAIRTDSALSREKERLRKLQEKATRESEKAKSAYQQESARLLELTKRAKDAAVQYGVNSKQAKSLRLEQQKLDKSIKAVDSSLGIHNRNVGNYGSALQGVAGKLLGAFGIVGGIQLLSKALKSAFAVSRDYEKQNAVLAGVLGKNTSEISKLTKESRRLGATTAFTASEVVELQVELARLGKTESEIIAMTEGIVDATIALGSETGETAALVGATLNAFQLKARDSSKVADILTLSTQRSALSFQKLNVALPIVSGAAAAAGYSLEQTVAMLGQAADRGIDASTAATSLRNIFLELSKKGITLSEALEKINKSQDKLSTANELFGKRAAVTALALADTTDKTKDLTEALENAGGTAKEVAETQLDTLDGQIRLLSSAWEEFILQLGNADSALGKFAVGTIEFLKNALIQWTNIDDHLALIFRRTENLADSTLKYMIESGQALFNSGNEIGKTLKQITENYEKLAEGAKKAISFEDFIAESLRAEKETIGGARRIAQFYVKYLEERAAEENKNAEIIKEKIKVEVEEIEIITDLIKIQEELLKQAREMPGRTEREVASRNNKIKIIELEIKRLKELGVVEQEEVEITTDLILIQEELLKQAREMPGKTENEIAARNNKIKIIELEIKRLRELGVVEQEVDDYIDTEAEKTEILKRALKERQDLEKEAGKSAFGLQKAVVNAIFESKNEQYEKDLEANSKYYDNLLSNEELSLEQRALFEAQRVEKENQIRADQRANEKKQFLFEQAMKVGEIYMNTSLAIAKTTAAYAAIPGGALIAAPIIGLIKANAALQIGTVLAQSIPKFAKGTMNAPEGLAMVGERGTELKITPKGEASFTPSDASLDYLEKGTKIIPNHDLVDMINRYSTASIINEGIPVSNNDILIANALLELKKENKKNNEKLLKALSKETKTKDNSIDRMRKNALQKKIEGKNLYN
ncbi:MAG TPA: phage tail tape measure protein [Bacteroidales bacterium]|nr:phage tail tape measure protein [Bacteroidales bacterium]